MERNVLLVMVGSREASAVDVQKTLTDCGSVIKTRLGIHDSVASDCCDNGLIFLELAGDKAKHAKLASSLNRLKGVKAKLVNLQLSSPALKAACCCSAHKKPAAKKRK